MTFDVRLVAYDPNGARLAPLPDTLDLAAGLPLGDVSSLTLTHSDLLRGSAFLGRPLGQGLEVALEVTTGAGWVEPAGCRFVRLEQSRAVTDDHLVRKVTLPSYAWMLRKMRLLSLANLNTDGKRPFLSATAGTILRTLIQESQARGTVTGLGIDFTTAADSSGAAWSKVITIYYAPGIDVWTVLDNLAAQGVVDWTMQGRTLRVFNPDSALAVDRSTGGNPVTLHLGRDVIDAPQSESLTDVVSTVLVRGEGSLAITEMNAAAPSPWGAWEGYIEQGGVSDEGTARTLVQGELERGSRVRGEYTRDLTLDSATWLPMVHYAPGDYILAPGGDGGRERLRVRQVTLTRDSNGIASGNVVLNDRMVEAEIRRAKRTAGIVGGSSAGGSGSRPSPEGPDKRTPAAPLGLVVDSNAYLDSDGAARGRLSALWDAVTTANDGSALEVAGYEVSARRDVVGAPWGQLTATEATNATAFAFDVGSTWLVRVRALGRYTTSPGDWSAAVSITIASDSTPPPTPSAPALTTRLGTVSVRWDGLAAAGGTGMPVDFSHVEVLQGAGGSPTLIGSLSEPGALPVTGLPYNTPTTFRLRSVDRSGNTSPMSVAASIETTPLVNTDVIGEVISGANLVDGSVTASEKIVGGTITGALIQGLTIQAGHIAANAITADKIQAGSITADKISAGAITAGKISADAITADKISAGAITAGKISADAITGKTITGGTINGTQVNSNAGLSIGAGGVIYFANTDGYVSGIRGFKAVTGAGSGVTIDATFLKAGRPFFETGTTTSAANLRQGVAGGEVLRATSRRAFKLEREEIEADYRILDLPGRTWRDRGEVEEDPTTERRHAGFVAEDLATISALAGGAFDSLLDTDDDGRPTGIAYDRVTAFLLPIVRDLSERLAALEAAATN